MKSLFIQPFLIFMVGNTRSSAVRAILIREDATLPVDPYHILATNRTASSRNIYNLD